MKKALLISLTIMCYSLSAQDINKNFERWTIAEKAINITGMDLSPDGKTVAMVCGKNQPVLLYNMAERTIIKEIDVSSKWMGYNIYYSQKGSYLLLQEKKTETSFKKSKQADYKVIDVAQGKVIHSFNKINDVKISFDESQMVTLENGTVHFRDIMTGKTTKSFQPEEACNALAISPDGQEIAVVIKPSKKEVMMVGKVAANKKVIKATAKTKHMIAIYSTETLMIEKVVQEFYDNINLLTYTDDGDRLLSFNMASNSYINVALPNQGYEPTREGYLSRTSMQPEFGYSGNQKYFAVATVELFPSLNIYEVETGSMLDLYNTKMKIWKNAKKGIYAGTNTSFVFLPGDKYILMSYGNSLIKWKFKKSNQ